MPTALVTGANRGLGLAFVKQLDKLGWRVFACCRNPSSAGELMALSETSGGRVEIKQLDIGQFEQSDRLAGELAGEPIDLLLNNAGIIGGSGVTFSEESRGTMQKFGELDFDEWMNVFKVNVVGTAKLTEALIDNIASSQQKTVVIMSSIMGSITANEEGNFPPPGGIYLYRTSKAAMNMLSRNMAADLKERGVKVVALNPGWVKTDMGGSDAIFEADDVIARLLDMVVHGGMEQSGKFISQDGTELSW
jgi:NAD(P)-dependent dehydrogenase (short-subunit alcohol dehydrogenase family)